MSEEQVRVGLGERSYTIHIGEGVFENAGAVIKPLLRRKRVVVVTDENVRAAQGARLGQGLGAAGIEMDEIVLSPGEQTKSFAELEALTGRLLDLGVERQDIIIALGGGVIGDLVGFAAAILRRGCRFVQAPTSLLAQVDSAVGGKTAVNAPQGKNLIGAFYQPEAVLADIAALETLEPRELRAGYAEVVKYGLIGDAPFFDWLEANGEGLLNGGDIAARIKAVKTSCEAKARIVQADERERGERALLNLGHTFGHALEAAFGYSSTLLHGEGVAIGMVLAFEYAARLGDCAPEDAARVSRHLNAAGLPTSISDLPASDALAPDNLLAIMMQDKKVEQGQLTLILPSRIGAAHIVNDASKDDVAAFLKEKTAR